MHHAIITLLKDAEKNGDLAQKQAMMINRDLTYAMKQALTSVIYACGSYHKDDEDTKAIHQQAVAATSKQGETIDHLAIPIETWLYRTVIRPDTMKEQWETALADVQHVRKVASRISRRLSQKPDKQKNPNDQLGMSNRYKMPRRKQSTDRPVFAALRSNLE